MNPKRPCEEDEKRFYLNQSRATGIFNWQEFAHFDFQDLIELAREKNADIEELELE